MVLPEALTAASTVKAVVTHLGQWLRNLRKAGQERQQQSLRAIDKVIPALRMTEAYARGVKAGVSNPSTEGQLAARWTELALELEALGLKSLAKKCDVTGRYWANPGQFPPGFLEQADIGLEAVERLARDLKAKVKLGIART